MLISMWGFGRKAGDNNENKRILITNDYRFISLTTTSVGNKKTPGLAKCYRIWH